jgi:Protein of unknown function (DUF1592)/Protein of unknown function (DUF1588)/Protein of unknown function (DUF1585)/Protein of unknown function (DUF1595)/Planctomycete cytochrome C
MRTLSTLYTPITLTVPLTVALLAGAFNGQVCPSETPSKSTGRQQETASDDNFESLVSPFVENFCYDCHQGDNAEGGIDFEKLNSAETISTKANDWLRIVRALESGSMPPVDDDQPSAKRKQRVLNWIVEYSTEHRHSQAAAMPVARRLTRLELENTLRDLFCLRADPFDNPARLVVKDDYFRPASGSMPFHVFALSQNQYLQRKPPELGEIVSLPGDAPILHGFNNDQSMISSPPVFVESTLTLARSLLDDPGFPGLTPLWDSMFVPESADDKEKQLAQARTRLAIFLDRAYRRPCTPEELDRYTRFFEKELASKDYTSAMKSVVAAVLSSAKFLFRLDRIQSPESAGMPREYATASRLSYFLWGSMPDAELLAAAREGRLSRDAEIRQNVRRMMQDPRIRNLSIDFGSQWLKIHKVLSARPDKDMFPGWYRKTGDSPGTSMMIEQMLLFETILVENRSIVDFISAEFAYLNITLMDWYKLDPVELIGYRPDDEAYEDYYRIRWPSLHRGGIISSGAMLASTSATTRTSPVYRGAWLLEVLFNRPAPPPPPNVPALEGDDNPAITVTHPREKLARHREDPACAVCHDRIDAIGFALERFDIVGRFRKTYDDGAAIDATGELNGEPFDGAARFRLVVLRQKDQFVRGFVEHLSRYAAGRELTLADEKALAEIMEKITKQGDRFSSVIEEVCVSPFILCRPPATPELPPTGIKQP